MNHQKSSPENVKATFLQSPHAVSGLLTASLPVLLPKMCIRDSRSIGNDVLSVEGLSKTIDGEKVLDNISFTLNHDDKVASVSYTHLDVYKRQGFV